MKNLRFLLVIIVPFFFMSCASTYVATTTPFTTEDFICNQNQENAIYFVEGDVSDYRSKAKISALKRAGRLCYLEGYNYFCIKNEEYKEQFISDGRSFANASAYGNYASAFGSSHSEGRTDIFCALTIEAFNDLTKCNEDVYYETTKIFTQLDARREIAECTTTYEKGLETEITFLIGSNNFEFEDFESNYGVAALNFRFGGLYIDENGTYFSLGTELGLSNNCFRWSLADVRFGIATKNFTWFVNTGLTLLATNGVANDKYHYNYHDYEVDLTIADLALSLGTGIKVGSKNNYFLAQYNVDILGEASVEELKLDNIGGKIPDFNCNSCNVHTIKIGYGHRF